MAALDPRIKSNDMGGHPADKNRMLAIGKLDGRVKPGHDKVGQPLPVRCAIDFPGEDASRLRGAFANPCAVLTGRRLDEVAPVLREAERHARQGRWALGMVAYEAAPAFDAAFRTKAPLAGLPLAAFAIFDAPSAPEDSPGGDFACSLWTSELSRAAFEERVETIRDGIAAGDYYQVNITQRMRADFSGDTGAFFGALKAAQPGAYALHLDFGAWQIASVSPELFFSWRPESGALVARPMKGTAPLSTPAAGLAASPKDRAENLMIVDLLRNDMARASRPGSVRVDDLFAVETYPTLRQMTSTVTAETLPGADLAHIFAALFPCGSITGAPKIAAMKAIAELEASPRGAYCGALGVLQPGGAALFSVGIRTVAIAQGRAECGLGSGVTWDSSPAAEYEECRIKRRFLLRASAAFELLETIKLENGAWWLIERHLERLARSAEHFGFPLDRGAVERALAETAGRHASGAHAVRLLVSRTGAVRIEAAPMPVTPPHPTVALAAAPISSDDEFLRHKTTSRAVYEAHAPRRPGIFDTLLFNERGEITEFTRGNIALELDGERVTPPESAGPLPGTLRAELLAQGTLAERIVMREDLPRATALWFVNGLRGMIPVRLAPPA
jgi:para-aminobenzoate synthetase / 4-amino-4-deoxychorismate lyase